MAFGEIVDQYGILLPGDVGLNERKNEHNGNYDKQRHRKLIFAEHLECAAPIRIIGIPRFLCIAFAVWSALKFLKRQLRNFLCGEIISLFGGEFQIFQQAFLQLAGKYVFNGEFAHLDPSFFAKLMRGSTSAISMSPKINPNMPMIEYKITSACTIVLSWRLITSTNKPPMPGMEYSDST